MPKRVHYSVGATLLVHSRNGSRYRKPVDLPNCVHGSTLRRTLSSREPARGSRRLRLGDRGTGDSAAPNCSLTPLLASILNVAKPPPRAAKTPCFPRLSTLTIDGRNREAQPVPEPSKRRTIVQVRGTPRSAWRSVWRTTRPTPGLRFGWQFLRKHVWPWLVNYVKYVLRPRRKLPRYTRPAAQRPGVFALPDDCVIALAADWGTGTQSAQDVAKQIGEQHPDVTIHLGDVYYSGTAREYQDYFLGRDDWPKGRQATYALNGNHEMYSGGEGYFGVALPALDQRTSYFCLENANWRFVAVDTGYY